MNRRIAIAFLFLIVMSGVAKGQYFGEQVMERTFEQTDFFFSPYRLVPFGLGTFKNSVEGVLDDPLLNLDVNPAYMYHDSAKPSYAYLDFRSSRDIQDRRNIYFPYPILADRSINASSLIAYPLFYINTRRELEPVVSAAYLFRPTEGALQRLSLGLTYQLVSQDEKYYPIPQDIYKEVVGADYLGVRTAGAENIPITDKFAGSDNIHQQGHFASLFTGYEINQDLQVGAKVGRVTFNRNGSYGSQNVWDSYYSINSSSLWRNSEARSQSYGHWELIGGLDYRFAQNYSAGFSGGHLWGDATQALTRGDSSYWSYGSIGSPTQNWSVYSSSGAQTQLWDHAGRTSMVGADLRAQVSPAQLLQFHYQFTHQNVDITLGGLIKDTSYGMSRYQSDPNLYTNASDYALSDRRNGSGTTTGDVHRAVASMQWNINKTVKLSIGMQYEDRSARTNTAEGVLAAMHSRSASTGSYPYNYFDSTAESKTLLWDFSTRLTQFTVPVFFTIRTSDVVELMFGLNRSVSNWEADDVTLALFDYRASANTQDPSYRVNFGERYTQPPERVSDIRTTVIAGLTVAPSNGFNIRFLVVPNFVETYTGTDLSDLQWWMSVNVMP